MFGERAWFGELVVSKVGSRLSEPVEPKHFEKPLFKKPGWCRGLAASLGKSRCHGVAVADFWCLAFWRIAEQT